MSEKLGNYTNYIDSIDVKKDKIDNGINEDRIKSEARKYVEKRIKEGINKAELQELLKDIKQLFEIQDIERINLRETLEKEIRKDTKEKLDKEKLVHEAKNTIYEKLGISNNIKSNNPVENFEKGIIDVLIVGNYDLAIEIYNTNGKVLIDALKQLASLEGLKQIAEALGESITGLFTGNAYEKGKSFAELGLVGTGTFAGLKIAKFGVKKLKNNLKNIPKNEILKSNDVKDILGDTKKLVYGILEKKWGRKTKLEDKKYEKINNISYIKDQFKENKQFGEILEKFILDNEHEMDIVKYLENQSTRDKTIKILKEILGLGKKGHIGEDGMEETVKRLLLDNENSLLKTKNFNRYTEFSTEILKKKPKLYSIGDNINLQEGVDIKKLKIEELNLPYSEIKELKEYGTKLPIVNIKLNNILEGISKDIGINDGFPSVSTRAKSPVGLLEKIDRMRKGNTDRAKRPDYKLADIPDAVGGRITVENVNQLEQVMKKIEVKFGKENIYEIENFYSSDKKMQRPYRVITYIVNIDGVPCEIQLSTLKSSLMADLDHNVIYKKIHEAPDDLIEQLSNLHRQTTIEEHTLLK